MIPNTVYFQTEVFDKQEIVQLIFYFILFMSA